MRTMTRRTRGAMICAACGMAMAWPASAAPPASLDQVPRETPVVISIRDVGALLDKLDAAADALGLEGQARMAPQMVNMMLSIPGIDRNGSMTLVLYPPEDGRINPDVLVVVPVSDYSEFASVMGGDADAAITTLNMQGNEVQARNLGGGYALLGDSEALVSGFDVGGGRLGAHSERLGVNGGRIADIADITIIVDVPMLTPLLRQQMEAGREQAEEQAQMLGEGGDQLLAAGDAMQEAVLRDARVGVVGLSVTDVGLVMDFGVQFKEGSESGAFFTQRGTSDQLIGRLPAVNYYTAWAVDLSAPGIRSLGEKIRAATPQVPGHEEEGVGMGHLFRDSTGVSGVVGANPGLMMTGIMANTVIYARTDDAGALMNEFQQTLNAADGSTVGGVSYNTEFNAGAKTIAGVPVSAYAINMDVQLPDGGGGFGPDPQMISQAMFGAAGKGPRGYVAPTEHGMVHTFSRSEVFMSKALEAAGGGAGLASNEMMQRISPLLPEGRTFEVYFALDQVGRTVAPFMLMMGMADQVPNFDTMPPIALGLTTDSGGVRATLIMPNEVIKTVYGLAPLASKLGGLGGGGLLAQ